MFTTIRHYLIKIYLSIKRGLSRFPFFRRTETTLWFVIILFLVVIPIVSFCWPTLKCLISKNESLWSYITAIATALLAISLVFSYEQIRLSTKIAQHEYKQILLSAKVAQHEFIKEIEKEFYSKRLIKDRINTCSKPVEKIELDDVIDFFEKVAYFNKENIIDLETIYELWDYWIGHYWVIHKQNIVKFREIHHNDSSYYHLLENLINNLAIRYHKNLEEYEKELEDDLEEFKKAERDLDSDVE
ncbi:MAG: hypothetical protein ABSG22_02105 [Sedimentisphaerales bacterium]|jgi:hypothetical protein